MPLSDSDMGQNIHKPEEWPSDNFASSSSSHPPRTYGGKLEPCTTSTWDIVGLPLAIKLENAANINYKDMLIGAVDTGVCDHPQIFAPGQIKKKGFYKRKEIDDTSDEEFHGTTTAFILAGSGSQTNHPLKSGVVIGGLPLCRINMYKAHGSLDESVGASIDAAIKDEVKMLNICFGRKLDEGEVPFSSQMSIGTFKAMIKNILPCVSAGNHGPMDYSNNFGGWEFVIGGCDSEFKFITELTLVSDGRTIMGQSINWKHLSKESTLVHAEYVTGSMMLTAEGKVLVCEVDDLDLVPNYSHPRIKDKAVGLIVILYGRAYSTFTYDIPVIVVSEEHAQTILQYMDKHQSNASVTIGASQRVDNPDFPSLAEFSPRLPGPCSRYLLKPDVSAQALEVLCTLPVTDENGRVWQVFRNGTSISTPIACAVAVHVGLAHQDWSASAIRSAVITSADPLEVRRRSDVHGMGGGIVNATHAVRPGGIYDISPEDYCKYALGLDECSDELRRFINDECGITEAIHPLNFNYPSFKTTLRDKFDDQNNIFNRTLTYVGSEPGAVFIAKVEGIDIDDKRLTVRVVPSRLKFAKEKDTADFKVIVEVHEWSDEDDGLLYADLVLECSKYNYQIRSRIVVVHEVN